MVPRGPLRLRGEATEVVERGGTAAGPVRGGASGAGPGLGPRPSEGPSFLKHFFIISKTELKHRF